MGLRLRILLVFLCIASISTAIVVAGVVYPKVGQYQKVNDELAGTSLNAAHLAAAFVSERLADSQKQAVALAKHDDLSYRNHASASAVLRRARAGASDAVHFVALEEPGEVVAGTEGIGSKAFASWPIVKTARGQDAPVRSQGIVWPLDGRPVVAVAVRYRYFDRQGSHWGVLVRASEPATWRLGAEADRVSLYDRQGQRLWPPGPLVPAKRAEVARALAGESGTRVDEATMVCAYTPVKELGWAVVAVTPAAQGLLPLNQDIQRAARFGFVALAVAGLLSFFLSGYIVAPIRRLEASAAAIARGDWQVPLPTERPDELGRLAETFTGMAQQLRARFHSIEGEVAQRTKELEHTNSQLKFAVEELKVLDELKRAFLDAVSHELRTPLNFVVGYGSGLEDGVFGELTPEQQHAVRRMMEGSDRLLEVINDLIEVSRLEAGELLLLPQPIDAAELASGVIGNLERALAERGHGVEIETAAGTPAAYADPQAVAQILRQLLSNAIKFTEPGGRITVAVRAVEERVEVAVTDTGVGIEPAVLPHIWEAFRQGDGSMTRRHGGTGVGLTIVKRLVDATQSTIDVTSTPGVGTTFRFTLPAFVEKAEEAVRAERRAFQTTSEE